MKAIAVSLTTLCWLVLVGCTRAPEPPVVQTRSLDTLTASALEQARAEVMRAPKSAAAWGALGQLLDATEFYPQAQQSYARAAELDPQSGKWLHLLGILQLQNDPEAGISNLARAVERVPTTNDAPRLRLARALIERGRFHEATNQLHALISVDPRHPAARLELARLLLADGNEEKLAEVITPCLTNAYTARSAFLLLSQARARQGQTEIAATLAERAARMPRPFDWPDLFLREVQNLRPQRTQMADQAGSLLARGRLTEAENVLTEMLAQFPSDPEALLLSGRLLLLQQKYPEAEQRFREHLQERPNSLNGLVQLSLAQLYQQKWSNAIPVLEQVVALKPDFAQAHGNLALARSRAGDSVGAIQSYREAIRCRPGDANTHAALAEELNKNGKLQEALEEIERALEIDPQLERAKTLRNRWR